MHGWPVIASCLWLFVKVHSSHVRTTDLVHEVWTTLADLLRQKLLDGFLNWRRSVWTCHSPPSLGVIHVQDTGFVRLACQLWQNHFSKEMVSRLLFKLTMRFDANYQSLVSSLCLSWKRFSLPSTKLRYTILIDQVGIVALVFWSLPK